MAQSTGTSPLAAWIGNGAKNSFVMILDASGGWNGEKSERSAQNEEGKKIVQMLTQRFRVEQVLLLRYSAGSIGLPLDGRQLGEVRFWNADGTPCHTCGNGTRLAVGWLINEHLSATAASQGTLSGVVKTAAGAPHLFHADVGSGRWEDSINVAMGTASAVWVARRGAEHELINALPSDLPEATAQVIDSVVMVEVTGSRNYVVCLRNSTELTDPNTLVKPVENFARTRLGALCVFFIPSEDRQGVRTEVWDYSTGEFTPACGVGACSAAVAAVELGLVAGTKVPVRMPGGLLAVETVRAAPHSCEIQLAGPVEIEREITAELLDLPAMIEPLLR